MSTDEGRLVMEWDKEGVHLVMRTARWSDLESYAAMHKTLFDERVMAGPRNANLRSGGEQLGRHLTNMACGQGVLLLVDVAGQVVAEGTLTPTDGDGFITLGLLVLKEYRDKGIGRRLMVALEEETRRLGKRRLYLSVWSANGPAFHLYTSMGYREVGRLPGWIRSDLAPEGVSDMVYMVKDL
ncbi:MAG: GNAT family N-acetyltransferase [Armatimonadetes bacterium]|nr:GNAT family N-acetyltransferase [Armatimonadota bacterium]